MWKRGKPEVKGRYFVLVDFDNPVMSEELGIVRRTGVPMVSNFTPEKGWLGCWPEMTVTKWMEVPPHV